MSTLDLQVQTRAEINQKLKLILNVEDYWHCWYNDRPSSLRLSENGYKKFIELLRVKSYDFTLKTPFTNIVLVQLERCLTKPYYIPNRKKIILFGEDEAMMLMLHSENLENYLNTLYTNRD